MLVFRHQPLQVPLKASDFWKLEETPTGDRWVEARKGAFILVPGGTPHDFENRSAARAGILNFSIPGGFESNSTGSPLERHCTPW